MARTWYNWSAYGFTDEDIEYIYKVTNVVFPTDPRDGVPPFNIDDVHLGDETTWTARLDGGNLSNVGYMPRAIKFKSGVNFLSASGWPNTSTTSASLKRWDLPEGAAMSHTDSITGQGGGFRGPLTIDGKEFDCVVVCYQVKTSSTSEQTPTVRIYCEKAVEPDPPAPPVPDPVVLVEATGGASFEPNVASFNPNLGWSSRLVPPAGKRFTAVSVNYSYTDEWGNDMVMEYNSIIDSEYNINVPAGTMFDGDKLTFYTTSEDIPVTPPVVIFAPRWWPDPGNYTRSADSVDVTDGPGEIVIYPKSGFKVTGAYIEVLDSYGNNTGSYISEWTRNNGNGSYSLIIPQGEGGTFFEVSVYTEALPVEDRTIAQTLLHCTSNIGVSTVPNGSGVPFVSGDKLIVTADVGYHFESKLDLTVAIAGTEYNADEVPTENVMTLSCGTVDWTSVVDDIIITASAHSDLPISDPDGLSLGFVNIYNPTADEMREAGSKQYISGSGALTDMSQYILKAFKIYAKPKVTDDKHEIMWGIYHSTVNAYLVTEAYVDLECGSVVIPEIYGNCLDYQPAVDVQLYLPFIGIVDVTPSDFIDKNATLTYRVDVLTGNCLASLASDGVVVNVWTGNMSEDIPLTVSRINTVNTQLGVEAVQMMCRTPYFIVKRNKPLIPDGSSRLDLDAEFWSVLGNLSGYTECLYVSVDGMTATSVEKVEIERLLKAGVII